MLPGPGCLCTVIWLLAGRCVYWRWPAPVCVASVLVVARGGGARWQREKEREREREREGERDKVDRQGRDSWLSQSVSLPVSAGKVSDIFCCSYVAVYMYYSPLKLYCCLTNAVCSWLLEGALAICSPAGCSQFQWLWVGPTYKPNHLHLNYSIATFVSGALSLHFNWYAPYFRSNFQLH